MKELRQFLKDMFLFEYPEISLLFFVGIGVLVFGTISLALIINTL